MSDFYPVIFRAVAKLANGESQGRQELYEHARRFLALELQQQRCSASEIIRQQSALERAILLVERQLRVEQPTSQTETSSLQTVRSRGSLADTVPPERTEAQQKALVSSDIIDLSAAPAKPQAANNPRLKPNISEPKVRRGPPDAETRRPKRPAYRDPVLVMLVGIVAVFCFAAVMSIPMAAIYLPRLVWVIEHLVDSPRLIVLIAGVFGVLLLLSLPIFGSRRKRTAFGFVWQSVYPILKA
jgi:hypothetical protein